ncbi:DUF1746-domain-containing protein [Sodiomyces alkalinus F11]|uniref:DUF1746-domain-containing protein n=1 Tax=Sodiomyces alkalinus (strain CBS 110278 / VKM F-3762 / F11) TaxID=1314773 RepID=A0A3N2PR01_SODAK|nr:DUF1746-domain-containing protein [Sodiomyces alkalinus F11]ROT36786.1 DUF1746-domain-containing protein [Sodiomyces alkalinus F11]
MPRRGDSGSSRRTPRRRAHRKPVKTDPGLAKKSQFLTHLLKHLDLLVYAEIATIYYMECSAVRFFLRAWTQQNFLSPKPDDWPIPMPAIQSQILAVFLPATLCLLVHIFGTLPTAGEASRGYLHGGMIVDFIGQKPPTTRLTLLGLDLLILVLQCFMLTVHAEREKIRAIIKPKRSRLVAALEEVAEDINELLPSQHDDVFRAGGGATRSSRPAREDNGDIEMQALGRTDSRGSVGDDNDDDDDDDDERSAFLGGASATSSPRASLLDVMSSGNGMLREFHVLHTIRSATPDFWGTVGHTLQSAGYQSTMARLRASRSGTRLGGN